MIISDAPSNVNSYSEPATAAHSNCSATEFPPETAPTEAPPASDDWPPDDPSLYLDVKGGRQYARPVANSGSIEFAEGLERSANPLQATDNYAGEAPPELRSAGLPCGEQAVALVQAMAADPSRNRIEPTAADFERLRARSVGHRSPAAGSREPAGRDAAKGNPHVNNMGVVIPSHLTNAADPSAVDRNRAGVDYIAATLPCTNQGGNDLESMAYNVAKYLYPDIEPEYQEFGGQGYTHSFGVPHGRIMFHPQRPEMGVHMKLGGQALALLTITPLELISTVVAMDGHFTRLDPFMDSDTVTMGQIFQSEKGLVSNARADKRKFWGNWSTGEAETITIGSRTSGKYVRIYDKAVEQGVDGTWTRLEVELKSDVAHQAALYLLEGKTVQDLITSSIDFRDRTADEKVTRCPRLSWWEDWLGKATKLTFSVEKAIEKTVVETFDWLKRQVGPTLSFLHQYFDQNPNWLPEFCDDNKPRISPTRRQMIAATPLPKRLEVFAVATGDSKAVKRSKPEKRQGATGLLDTLLAAGVPRDELDLHMIMGAA